MGWNNPTNLTDPTGFTSVITCEQDSSCFKGTDGNYYGCRDGGGSITACFENNDENNDQGSDGQAPNGSADNTAQAPKKAEISAKPEISYFKRVVTTGRGIMTGVFGATGAFIGGSLDPDLFSNFGSALYDDPTLADDFQTGHNFGYALGFWSMLAGAKSTSPTIGVLEDSVFAQVPAKLTKAFSEEGKQIYSQAAGRPIKTVNDLAKALKQGVVKPSQVPIIYVVIDGQKVIHNTRSSTALIDAGIPKSQWHGIDKTGKIAYDNVTFDQLVRNQLDKNYNGSVQEARR